MRTHAAAMLVTLCLCGVCLDGAFAAVDAARNGAVATNLAAWGVPDRQTGNVEYDALAIIHMGTLRFDEITNRVGVWAVMDVQPRECGSIGGTALYNQNGELLIAADRKDLLIFDGHWQITDLLGGRPERTSGKYQFIVTGRGSNRHITDLSRFVLGEPAGGTILCRLDVDANWKMSPGPDSRTNGLTMIYRGPKEIGHDPAMFSPLYLILPGWETYVKPAYERFLGLKQLCENELDSAKEKELRVVLDDENPLLASMAFRRLVESDKMGDAEVAGILSKASGYQVSVRTFLWLSAKSKSVPTGARPSGPVLNAIAKVKSRRDLEFLALGAYAAARWSDESLKSSQEVLAVVMQALDKHPDPLDAAARQRRETLECVVGELGKHSKPQDPREGGMRKWITAWPRDMPTR